MIFSLSMYSLQSHCLLGFFYGLALEDTGQEKIENSLWQLEAEILWMVDKFGQATMDRRRCKEFDIRVQIVSTRSAIKSPPNLAFAQAESQSHAQKFASLVFYDHFIETNHVTGFNINALLTLSLTYIIYGEQAYGDCATIMTHHAMRMAVAFAFGQRRNQGTKLPSR